MDLANLEWGDVVLDTGEVVVVEALHDEDRVRVVRWQGGVLDDEQRARHLLADAGVAAAQLLGDGPGWMVLEELGESMWRPGRADDLADPAVLRALAGWFARVHAVVPQGLSGAPELSLLAPDLLDALRDALAGAGRDGVGDELAEGLAHCAAVLGPAESLVVGSFGPTDFAVLGGAAAMATELSLAAAGVAEQDLARVGQVLDGAAGASARELFLDAWAQASGREPRADRLAAVRAVELAVPVLVQALQGQQVGGGELSVLLEALRGVAGAS